MRNLISFQELVDIEEATYLIAAYMVFPMAREY